MTTYEFVNPSDGIVFDAPSAEVAALAALVVGVGKCIAVIDGTKDAVIDFAFFGGDGGYHERYGRSLDDGLTALAADVVAACQSFRIRSGERTSMSDWCGRAHGVKLRMPDAAGGA